MKKPKWVVAKEQARKAEAHSTVWLFGLHAVRDALRNPQRTRLRLVLTKNAAHKLAPDIAAAALDPEIVDPRKFDVPIDPSSVHQGAALEVKPLEWGPLEEVCDPAQDNPRVILLDRVSDPHNVGAILRSAEVLGARAVIATARHAAPETGALAKTASGALERQPYLRVRNLAQTMGTLRNMGYQLIGLAGEAEEPLPRVVDHRRPVALVLGAEGPGLRQLTRTSCEVLAKIPASGAFGSLNVSNAAALSLYIASNE